MIKKLEPKDITDQLVAEINNINDDCSVVGLMKDFVADPDYFFLVDFEDEKVAGFVYGYFVRGMRTRKWSSAHLWTIAISEKYRRKGIGSALISQVKQECLARDCHSFFLITQTDNPGAIEFYFKLGGKYINNDMDKVIWFRNF